MPIRRIMVALLALSLPAIGWAAPSRALAARPATAPDADAAWLTTAPSAEAAWPATAPSAQPATRPAAAAGSPAAVITLAGEVDDYNADALMHNFDRARKLGAKVIILRVNTYGGLVTSGLDISRFIKNQTDLHTIAFIDSKAISAGAMIALACDEIVMKPSGTLGDCAPIIFRTDGNLEALPPDERSKQESPVVKDFEDSARRNGYDPMLVTTMVSAKRVVYYLEDEQGHRRFADEETYKKLTSDGAWKPVAGLSNPVDGPMTLLTVTTDEAIKLGLARGTAMSVEGLAAERAYPVVADLTPTAGDKLVTLLGSMPVRAILLIVFLNSLFVAFKMPGHGAPEAIALLTLGLLVGVPLLTGYAQWWEIATIFVGLGLVAFEIFVFPGHMVSLVAGTMMVVTGLLFTFVGDVWAVPGSWAMPTTWAHLEHGLYVVVGGLACSMLLSMWLRRFLPSLPYFNRLILTTTAGGAAGSAAPLPHRAAGLNEDGERWPFVGTVGIALSELKPGGRAEFPYGGDTRSTSVVCECGYVPAGTKLAVREVHGNRVVVRPVGLPA